MKKTTLFSTLVTILLVLLATSCSCSSDSDRQVNLDQITQELYTPGKDTILETGCDQMVVWQPVHGKSCSGKPITWKKPIIKIKDRSSIWITQQGGNLTPTELLSRLDAAGGMVVPKNYTTPWTEWSIWENLSDLFAVVFGVLLLSALFWLLGWMVKSFRDFWNNRNNFITPTPTPTPVLAPQPQNYLGGLDSAINKAVSNGVSVELTLKIGGTSSNTTVPAYSGQKNTDRVD